MINILTHGILPLGKGMPTKQKSPDHIHCNLGKIEDLGKGFTFYFLDIGRNRLGTKPGKRGVENKL
jgi:hypothetical protein